MVDQHVVRMAPRPKNTLLSLPPELILRILSHLPLKPLLTFSLASHRCRTLSQTALHDLAFAIYPSRLARNMANIPDPSNPYEDGTIDTVTTAAIRELNPPPPCPHPTNHVDLIIPQAETMDQATLAAFHDALHRSILTRYATGLRVLELSLWRLRGSVAAALCELRGLVSLTLEVTDPFMFKAASTVRRMPELGSADSALVREEDGVWQELVKAWKGLRWLRLGGVRITAADLAILLERNRGIRELWLNRCELVLPGIWPVLREWRGRENLTHLGVIECGVVSMDCLETFGELNSLQVSSLSDFGSDWISSALAGN